MIQRTSQPPQRPSSRRERLHRVRNYGLVSGTTVVLLASLVACSSSARSTGAKTSYDSKAGTISFTYGDPNPGVNDAWLFYAVQTGVFQRVGLKPKMVVQGSLEPTNLAAGRLALGDFGTPSIFPSIEAGHKMNMVFMPGTGNPDGGIVVKAKAGINKVMDLSGKSVGCVGLNGQGYGAAASWSTYIQKQGGKALHIVVEPNAGALTSAVESGQVAAAFTTPIFGKAIAAGLLKQLIAATDPLTRKVTGVDMAAAAEYGSTAQLQKNRTAVTRWVAAARIGLKLVNKASDAQVADVLSKNSLFAPSVISKSALISEIARARPFWGAEGGFVSKARWKDSLKIFGTWGLNLGGVQINLQASQFSYGSVIDMSYWNDATALVNSYFKKYTDTP